ncbi:MAG TPA: DinB family protein [Anaerolineae bacterium]
MSQPKALLFARLATARAALWRELVAVDRDVLETQPITGEWTAKDLLAHIAAWDDLHADRVALILAGRAHEIRRTNRDELNDRLYHERADWPLEQVVSVAQDARRRFLALLAPLTWTDLTTTYPTPDGDVSILFLAERRGQHDMVHTHELQAWQDEAIEDHPGPKPVLAAALAAGRDALLAWGKVVPPEEYDTRAVCGTWTWQDVLGHIADWEMFSVRGLRAMAEGQPGGTDYDDEEERWNQGHVDRRRGQPLAETWQDFAQAFQDLLEILAGFDDAQLAQPANTEIEDLDAYYYWFSTCFAHDFEHVQSLNDTLATDIDFDAAEETRAPAPIPDKINVAAKFTLFADRWSPKIIAEVNDQYVKLARLQGEFVWHRHDAEDELFLVLSGQLTIRFRERAVTLGPGEMIVVPAGVDHQPATEGEVQVLLLEPKTTLNTGNVRDEHTIEHPVWI